MQHLGARNDTGETNSNFETRILLDNLQNEKFPLFCVGDKLCLVHDHEFHDIKITEIHITDRGVAYWCVKLTQPRTGEWKFTKADVNKTVFQSYRAALEFTSNTKEKGDN